MIASRSTTSLKPVVHDDRVWGVLLAAARTARGGLDPERRAAFALNGDASLGEVSPDDPRVVLSWAPDAGWTPRESGADPRLALYLPLCAARPGSPVVVGHLAQSLDGFIATQAGESQWLTGDRNVVHMHCLRALCDAVIVGADTVAADNSRLTTRLVPGPNPLRVVLDPRRRLEGHFRVFSDGAAPTLLVCEAGHRSAERFGQAEVLGVPGRDGRLDLEALLQELHRRGCHAVFVEGGGVTVSRFLEAGLLDRLHVAIAPLVVGQGRPGLRLPAAERLSDGLRPARRLFRMGEDVLFDCDLRRAGPAQASTTLERVL
jgi:riboflavin-specific deaminase-like protein